MADSFDSDRRFQRATTLILSNLDDPRVALRFINNEISRAVDAYTPKQRQEFFELKSLVCSSLGLLDESLAAALEADALSICKLTPSYGNTITKGAECSPGRGNLLNALRAYQDSENVQDDEWEKITARMITAIKEMIKNQSKEHNGAETDGASGDAVKDDAAS